MPSFKIHTIDSAPAAARGTLEAARKKFGFLPNLLGELAAAPSALNAYVTLSELLAASSLRPVEQQVVLIATSAANGCTYCVAAHTAGLKSAGLPVTQEQVLEVLVGIAMKTLSNYTNHIAETPIDAQLRPFAWEPTIA